VKVAVLLAGRKSIVPVPDSSGVQLMVAVGPLTVMVSLPAATFVRDALLLELMLPLKACARADSGANAPPAIAIVAQDTSKTFRLARADATAVEVCWVIDCSMATGEL
jgi:hypothetical protein